MNCMCIPQARRMCYRFSTGVTDAGKKFDMFVAVLIVLNVVAVISEAEPSLGNRPGPTGARIQLFFDIFEVCYQATVPFCRAVHIAFTRNQNRN